MEKLTNILSNKFSRTEFSITTEDTDYLVSLETGINLEYIQLIEKSCKLAFISVVPYQRFSGASWIILRFRKVEEK